MPWLIEFLVGNMVRKTNFYFKRKKFLQKMIISFIVVHIIVLSFFSFGFINHAKAINQNNYETEIIIVENTQYVYSGGYTQSFRIISNGIIYRFPNMGVSHDYSSRELYEIIKPGTNLKITYIEEYSLFGKYKRVSDARTDDAVFLDFAQSLADENVAFTLTVIFLLVIEFIILSIFVICLLFNAKDLKLKVFKHRASKN